MSKEKVTSLAEAQAKRDRERAEQDHALGKAFRLRMLSDEAPLHTGLADQGLVVLIPEGSLEGFAMSREYARKLGTSLLEIAEMPTLEEET